MAANPSIQLGTDSNWAIKEDNLLAYKKDGTRFFNKEFDFTRGSLATFVDKDGLIKVSGVTNTKLVVNGDFATNLNGWTNSNNHWQWTSQGAYFPETTTHNPLSQTLVNDANVILKFTFTLNIIKGTVNVTYEDSTNASIQTQYTTSGTYTIYTTPVEANTTIYFSRYGGINTEFYLNNVSAFEIQTDVPRIDFTDDTTGHLLLEPQSTNLITHSEDFSSLNIRNNAVVTSNAIVSPSGVLDADEITFDGTYSGRVEQTIPATIGQSYTISLYLKNKDLSDKTQVWIGFSAAAQGQFVTITDEWQRYLITVPADGTSEYPRIQFSGTGSLYAWGFQVEQLSYATSYIPTNGSAVTRNAEVCNNSGSAQDFNSEEGVLYAEISALANDGTNRFISLTNGVTDATNISLAFTPTTNQIRALVDIGYSLQVSITHTVSSVLDFNKVAFLYKQNDFKLYINGVLVGTDTSGNVPSANYFNDLSFIRISALPFYGKCKDLKVFKRAMSDGELYLLTVPQYQSYQEMATALNYTL